ncbi:MarR family winged helix-turn-helix transcriptional regulator [Nocardia jiangxiensis]|uniref:MarR family winged helix-turn-helix transcriptional regulator n=1 Tax=Nocardia jiangxiensis TaxID=282685 RepID=A0ABW6SE19_9NOCA
MIAPLPHDIAGDLTHAMVRLRARLRAESAPTDMKWSWSQITTLNRIAQEGSATVSELAVAEHVRPQSMASIVSALLDGGLVARRSDPNDGRKTLISITDEGAELLARIPTMRETWLEAAIERHLSPAECETLANAARIMESLADC